MKQTGRAQAATRIEASQFLIAEQSWLGLDTLPTPANGLISTGPDVAVVIVGASSGRVIVEVEARESPPAALDAGPWDEVVETDFSASSGSVIVRALMDDAPELPVLTVGGPGLYRLRLHAAGRDVHRDEVALEPSEKYLIQMWPTATAQAETVFRHSDALGASLRHQAKTAPSPPSGAPRQPPPKTAHVHGRRSTARFRSAVDEGGDP